LYYLHRSFFVILLKLNVIARVIFALFKHHRAARVEFALVLNAANDKKWFLCTFRLPFRKTELCIFNCRII